MTAPLILAFDTSAAHCAVALLRGQTTLSANSEAMSKGQAERLMGLLSETLAAHSLAWAELSALAVGTGPGNFTGIRIGVSAARGLALGLGIPAYGVTGFDARARLAPPDTVVAVPAPRGLAYVQGANGPETNVLDEIANMAPHPSPAELATAIAQHAASLWPSNMEPPAPFYIRAPDAAPARDAAPQLLP